MIDAIVAGYDRLDPADASYFAARRDALEAQGFARYDELRREIRARYAGVPVGYSESVFEGLGEDLGLTLMTPRSFARAVAEGTDVTAADKQAVDAQARDREIAVWVFNSQNVTPDVQRVNELARTRRDPVATVTETLAPAGASFQSWQTDQLQKARGRPARLDGPMTAPRIAVALPPPRGRPRAPLESSRWTPREAVGLGRRSDGGTGRRRPPARRCEDGDHRTARRAELRAVGGRDPASAAARGREASRASIYRVMEELEDDRPARAGRGRVRARCAIEPVRGAAGHHHHLVCERCGRLEPFSDDGLERAIERVSERLALDVSEHEIVLRGACAPALLSAAERAVAAQVAAAAAGRAAADRRRAAAAPSPACSRGLALR